MAAAALALLGGSALADDLDALLLADELPEQVAEARPWRGLVEAGLGAGQLRQGGGDEWHRRLALDLRVEHAFSAQWRGVFADRLDLNWPAQYDGEHAINTVKEAYLSWQPAPAAALDLGRVNARYGVAMGYNPTDYFRDGALRSVVSIDPASLKENRQGSVMLRGQWLWQGGALSLLYSPRLERHAEREGWSLDLGATNDRQRGLLAVSQRLGGAVSAQFLLYQEEGGEPQFGLNLSGLIGNATVAYLEWSGGRAPSLLSQALGQDGPVHWRNHLAGGLRYTTTDKLTLTAELQYSGSGLDRDGWAALRAGPPALYGLYRQRVFQAQELPTRRALFLHAHWQDALIHRLDLSAMANADLVDHSHRLWLEARYRGERLDYVLQWQGSHGRGTSNYGALPESQRWELAVRRYF